MQKGLTLIELLITIVVATILMGVAVPSYQQLKDNNELDRNTQLIFSYLQRVKLLADQQNKDIYIHVNNTGGTYCLVASQSTSVPTKCYDTTHLLVLSNGLSQGITLADSAGNTISSWVTNVMVFNGVRGTAKPTSLALKNNHIQNNVTNRKLIIASGVGRLRLCQAVNDKIGAAACSG
ncbi:MAG: prepilin-type N-terminal cleavage/methylation domain-containing protein [Plesiomonas sp.]